VFNANFSRTFVFDIYQTLIEKYCDAGADPGFQVRGGALTPKNQFFSNFVDPPGSSPVMGKTTEEIDGNEYIDLTIYISGLC
jgi:hypothetical protein